MKLQRYILLILIVFKTANFQASMSIDDLVTYYSQVEEPDSLFSDPNIDVDIKMIVAERLGIEYEQQALDYIDDMPDVQENTKPDNNNNYNENVIKENNEQKEQCDSRYVRYLPVLRKEDPNCPIHGNHKEEDIPIVHAFLNKLEDKAKLKSSEFYEIDINNDNDKKELTVELEENKINKDNFVDSYGVESQLNKIIGIFGLVALNSNQKIAIGGFVTTTIFVYIFRENIKRFVNRVRGKKVDDQKKEVVDQAKNVTVGVS